MGAKQYLQQARWLDNTVNAKLEQIDRLRSLAERITVEYSGNEKIISSHDNDQLTCIVAKIVDLEKSINADIDKLVDLKAEINSKLTLVTNDTYKLILTMRYINCLPWWQISYDLRSDMRWVYRIHKNALKEFEEKLI